MDVNHIEQYELINGYVIVDNNFKIITANEAIYKFIGISSYYTLTDVIHQVDTDDFIDVANSLRMNQKKTMTLRMKRADNSYRWVLVDLERKCITSEDEESEYLELKMSDVVALRNYSNSLENTIQSFRHIMAMDNELFFIYEYDSKLLTLYYFIDNEMATLISKPIEEVKQYIVDNKYFSDESMDVLDSFFEDLKKGTVSYLYNAKANIFEHNIGNFMDTQIKGSTIYSELKPSKSVGSFKVFDDKNGFTKKTYEYRTTAYKASASEIENYFKQNVLLNPKINLCVILLEIDNISDYEKERGKEAADNIRDITMDIILKVMEYRGIVSQINDTQIAIVIKNTNNEQALRAFLEYIRTRIAWNTKLYDNEYKIKFSIGICRYPENGTSDAVLSKKLLKAMEIAKKKGGNRYIIYKETIHGEIEE